MSYQIKRLRGHYSEPSVCEDEYQTMSGAKFN